DRERTEGVAGPAALTEGRWIADGHKPDPEVYDRALRTAQRDCGDMPMVAVAFEDSRHGVAAAMCAGQAGRPVDIGVAVARHGEDAAGLAEIGAHIQAELATAGRRVPRFVVVRDLRDALPHIRRLTAPTGPHLGG